MTEAAIRLDDRFSADAFFARAAARLLPEPPDPAAAISLDLRAEVGLAPTPVRDYRDAAVLIPVVPRGDEVRVLLTVRHDGLPSHPGQVAFPGGKIDRVDRGPADAALREAEEEIGLARHKVTPVGFLDAYLTGTGYRIAPLVGLVDPDHQLVLNPGEVTATFEVPLAFLMEPANHMLRSRDRDGRMLHFYEMPYEGFRIWGVTAGIIRGLYERVYR